MEDTFEYRIFEKDEFMAKLDKLSGSQGRPSSKAMSTLNCGGNHSSGPISGNSVVLPQLSGDTGLGIFAFFYTVDEDDRVVSMVTIEDRNDAYR